MGVEYVWYDIDTRVESMTSYAAEWNPKLLRTQFLSRPSNLDEYENLEKQCISSTIAESASYKGMQFIGASSGSESC